MTPKKGSVRIIIIQEKLGVELHQYLIMIYLYRSRKNISIMWYIYWVIYKNNEKVSKMYIHIHKIYICIYKSIN